jgi:ABC-2 type transport system ATP-binding protein
MSMVSVENLFKTLNNVEILHDLSFSIGKGEILTFLGPNGAGKTTTINILSTLLKPTSGSAQVAGYNTVKESEKIRRIIGYLQEDFSLYPNLTVYDNLDFWASLYVIPKPDRRSKINRLLEDFELIEKKESKPPTLSKGMIQKVGLIKSLINEPKVIFLDEPTSGLDPIMTEEVQGKLLNLREEGATLLITTHILSQAELISDKIAVISKGRIVYTGDITDIKKILQASNLSEVYHKLMVDRNE